MPTTYRAVVIGCSRMGAFIDNEIPLKTVTIQGMADDESVSTLGIPMRLKPPSILPYGHSAAYEACERTELVAGCDLRPEIREQWGKRFGVGADHLYEDYKEMLEQERPEIVSIATQPEHRAAIILYAAEHGAKAIYAEKALCASLEEADAIYACLQKNGVHLNVRAPAWHRSADNPHRCGAGADLSMDNVSAKSARVAKYAVALSRAIFIFG
jgi:hypothetical protein